MEGLAYNFSGPRHKVSHLMAEYLRGPPPKSIGNSICTALWGKPKEDLSVSIGNKFHYIFSAVFNYDDKNKMQVLGKTLDLYETSNMIFSRNFNENSEPSFVTLTFYIRIYA